MKLAKRKQSRTIAAAARWSCRILVSAALAGCGADAEPAHHAERQTTKTLERDAESDCHKSLDFAYYHPMPSWERQRPEEELRHMRESIDGLFRGGESLERYLEFFGSASHLTADGVPGELMFPGVAEVIRDSKLFRTGREKRFAARSVAKILRPRETGGTRLSPSHARDTQELLKYMPNTAVALLTRTNRSGSGIELEEMEDISQFFLHIIKNEEKFTLLENGKLYLANPRIPIPDRGLIGCILAKRERMSREQLNDFDIYYSELVWNWRPLRRDIVCKHFHESVPLKRFGIVEPAEGLRAGYCTKREKREEPEFVPGSRLSEAEFRRMEKRE